jgi:hypothetical protein
MNAGFWSRDDARTEICGAGPEREGGCKSGAVHETARRDHWQSPIERLYDRAHNDKRRDQLGWRMRNTFQALQPISELVAGLPTRSAAAGPYGDGIEQIAYPCREALLRDRLLDHLDARIEPTLVDNGISGITRRKQNFETGSPILCLFRQLSTVDAG